MTELEKIGKKPKKWHQKWWGVIFLLFVALVILYAASFIYQVVTLVEAQNQLSLQNYSNNQDVSLSTSLRNIVENPEAPYWGPAAAKIVIVEFSDFGCPYCKEADPILKRIRQEYQDYVRIIYRHFPNLAAHANALKAALASECAAEQDKFWPYQDLLFANQDNLAVENLNLIALNVGLDTTQFAQCLDSQKYLAKVQNDMQDGLKLGINGTPTYFINGIKVPGVIPYDAFKTVIEKLKQIEDLNSKSQSPNFK